MRYRILHPMESGPDVGVYLVADGWRAGRRAVLTLLPRYYSDVSQRPRLDELFALRSALDHPFLVQVRDLAFRGKRIGLISDFVDGVRPLDTLSSQSQRRLFSIQLVELLSYLHRRSFVCGFLRPSQVFLVTGGGLVANLLCPEEKNRPRTGGKDWVRYSAPEFLRAGCATRSADLYSLGLVFYRLFVGQEPYAEQDFDSLAKKQRAASPVRPRFLNPDVPADIEQLIQDLIQKDPQLRPSLEYVSTVLRQECKPWADPAPRFRSQLIGRDVERSSFQKLLGRHLSQPGPRFVAIAGTSGVGKTALTQRLAVLAKIRRAEVYNLDHHRRSGVFEAFAAVQKSIAEGAEGAGVSKEHEGQRTKPLDPRSFVRDFLQALVGRSRHHCVVLCVNDLQWMDEGCLEIYRAIFQRQDLSVLVIANYRTDEHPGYWEDLRLELSRGRVLSEFRLGPLREQEVTRLLAILLGGTPPKQLAQKVLSQCTGNPFYIYEFLRLLREKGDLFFRAGHWVWESGPDEPSVPASVIDSISARLQGVDAGELSILEHLSVIQRPTRIDWLAKMMEISFDHLKGRLTRLEVADLVWISSPDDLALVALGHEWLGRVLRNNIHERRRVFLHQGIASFFDSRAREDEKQIDKAFVVRHFLEAGNSAKVRKLIWPAVCWLEEGNLYKEAAELLDKATEHRAIRKTDWKHRRKALQLFFLSGQLDKCNRLATDFLLGPVPPPHQKSKNFRLLASRKNS